MDKRIHTYTMDSKKSTFTRTAMGGDEIIIQMNSQNNDDLKNFFSSHLLAV